MTYPTWTITKGPGQRDLEQAFIARKQGATATFSLFIESDKLSQKIHQVKVSILNFSFVTCLGPNYKLGGLLVNTPSDIHKLLPKYNFIFVEYNAEDRLGKMEFSNGE